MSSVTGIANKASSRSYRSHSVFPWGGITLELSPQINPGAILTRLGFVLLDSSRSV
jgi:hypothetical protein